MPLPVAKLAITVGMTLANMALTMSRKIEGPRLDDTKFTGGDYGASLPMVWGMRRQDCSIFWAEDLREVKRRRKTKGGKFNDYSYFGTWAVALAGHEIAGVRRIWFDTHLVYDLSGAGPVTPFDFGGAGVVSDYITIYLGTDTQDVDPRMDAWCTDRYGEGSCPAYRDTAYIVFKDIPLEKVGNRIPQVSVEVLGASDDVYPIDYASGASFSLTNARLFSQDFALYYSQDGADFSIYDVAARQQIISGAKDWDEHPTIRANGNMLALDGTLLREYTLDGSAIQTLFDYGSSPAGLHLAYDGNGIEHRLAIPAFVDSEFWFDEVEYTLTDLIGEAGWIQGIFTDLDGNVWGVGKESASATTIHFYRFVTIDSDLPDWFTVSGLPSYSGSGFGPACHYRDDTVDQFVFKWGGDLYAADTATATVSASQTNIDQDVYLSQALLNLPLGSASIWVGHEEFSLADLSEIREVAFADWNNDYGTSSAGPYDPINHAIIMPNDDEQATAWLYLDRIGPGTVTLGGICEDVADWCGVEDADFSDLDQPVTGWSATRGQASNILEPLLDAYDSDFRPHDFTVEGLKRTGVSAGSTLLTERFVGDPRYSVAVRQASELPRAVLIDFADIDADQQPQSIRSDRPLAATDARGEKKIDLTTLALASTEARNLADRHFRRLWNERLEPSLSLTAQNLGLEPGDVRTLSLDGEEMGARCIRVTVQADDILATEWRYDHPSLALLDGSTGASFDGRDEQNIPVPLLSRGLVLDIPLLHDSDEASVPQVYPLAAPWATGTWPGATVYQGIDGEFSEELASIPSSGAMAWGYVAEAMPYANPNLWDRGTVLTVTLQVGELTGCTEAAADANPRLNQAVIGAQGRWEIVQYTVATLVSPMQYEVSGFKRGRRGTEWAAELHAAGDTFALVSDADAESLGLSDVGTDLVFKAITSGRTEVGAPEIPVEPFTGATLMPYAPCHLEAVKESNDDWTITWVRRTRVGGAWTSGTTIPLGEDSEEYEVDILDSMGDVVRTYAGLTGPTVTYLAADQITDGGDVAPGDLDFAVYQISAAVDRGFAAIAAA